MALRKVKTKTGTLIGMRIVKPYSAARKAKAAATRRTNKLNGVKRKKR